jgi:hypothetical protein
MVQGVVFHDYGDEMLLRLLILAFLLYPSFSTLPSLPLPGLLLLQRERHLLHRPLSSTQPRVRPSRLLLPGNDSAETAFSGSSIPSPRTIGFVIIFSTFLLRCVDFSLLRTLSGQKTSLEDIIVPRCVAK